MTPTAALRPCDRCVTGLIYQRYEEDPACITCGHVSYATTTPESDEVRRTAKRRGYRIHYTGDHRNLAHLKVFVEPDRESRYYGIRCPFDGHPVGRAHGGGYVGRDGETRGGGYVCSEGHLIYVLRDHTNAPISWS
jgi:hypothetical protein